MTGNSTTQNGSTFGRSVRGGAVPVSRASLLYGAMRGERALSMLGVVTEARRQGQKVVYLDAGSSTGLADVADCEAILERGLVLAGRGPVA